MINLIELSSLMVQNIYLIYTAYCHKINIRINKNILIKKINKDIFFIYKTYIIEDHYNILDNSIQKYIDHNY